MYPDDLEVRPVTVWPGALTPDDERHWSPFQADLRTTVRELRFELKMVGAAAPVLEVAIPPTPAYWRQDGRPRANARADHPGIVLSLPTTHVGPLRYFTDRYTTWQDNLRAVVKTMTALRAVDRYGVVHRGEQYQGFKALPAGTGADASAMTSGDAWNILARAAEVDGESARLMPKEALRMARRATHPDVNNGEHGAWDLVREAAELLRLERQP